MLCKCFNISNIVSIRQWLCIDKIYWKGKSYSITQPEGEIFISEGYYTKDCKYYNALSNEECIDIEGMRGDTTDEISEWVGLFCAFL